MINAMNGSIESAPIEVILFRGGALSKRIFPLASFRGIVFFESKVYRKF